MGLSTLKHKQGGLLMNLNVAAANIEIKLNGFLLCITHVYSR